MSVSDEDDRDVQFVDELPEYLKCPICLCCLNNPYQTPCGHRFCKECIVPILSSRNNACPIDRTAIDPTNTFPDNAVKLQINNLKIKCSNEGCGWTGSFSDRRDHRSKCKFANIQCELCGAEIPKNGLEAHKAVCPKQKVQCEYCHEEVARADLQSHHSQCPLFPVVCQYNCSAQPIPRKVFPAHYNECPMAPVLCTMAPFGCTEQVQRSLLPAHLLQCAPLRAGAMATVIVKLQKQVEELKIAADEQTTIIQTVHKTLYPSAGQFTWRIDNIREKIKAAQAGDTDASVIYSPPFFSSEAGYKLCLCIYPAGDHNQAYLSLYFVIMKGQFDEILQWPFQKRVFLSLLNCKGGPHVMKDIQPDPRLHYFHRPDNPRNVGYGYPKFIALSKLLSDDAEHVENEALFLRCKVFD